MDYKFIQNIISGQWTILSPRRAKRPDMSNSTEKFCPFCKDSENLEDEVYRIGGKKPDKNWQIRVLSNKFPFAPIHEVVIHSPDHEKNFEELPLSQNELIFKTFKDRFKLQQDKGQVVIFHNHGRESGESLFHPHSQIVVIPEHIGLDIPQIDFSGSKEEFHQTEHFLIFAPLSSQWPDEVWISPKADRKYFSEISDPEIKDLSKIIYRLIQIFTLRHGEEFPYNFYISPLPNWYLRIIPRVKIPGGFELATGVFVNTQDPKETIKFIKDHFETPDEEKIRTHHRADYKRSV